MVQTTSLNPRKNPRKVSDDIPIEIFGEILKYLPFKPLARFRCVSKSWCSLISSPHFAKSHAETSSTSTDLARHRAIFLVQNAGYQLISLQSLLYDRTNIPKDGVFRYRPISPRRCYNYVGSCKGLICYYVDRQDFFLWNPCTRKLKKLPPLPSNFDIEGCGFGYDESSNDYKVLAAGCGVKAARVYSFKTDSWKTLINLRGAAGAATFAGGKLYWGPRTTIDSPHWNIKYFDLEKEIFGEIKNPYSIRDLSYNMYLGVFNGCICLYCKYFTVLPEKHRAAAWLLRKDDQEYCWEKVSSISLLMSDFDQQIKNIRFCFSTKDEIIFSGGSEMDFVVYNMPEVLLRRPEMCNLQTIEGVYVESVASLETQN